MGYDLYAKNEELDRFHFGAFSWPILEEVFGYLFPYITSKGRWYAVYIDPRFDEHGFPDTNDGFPVTDNEAKIMARMTRNFVAIQRSITDDVTVDGWPQRVRADLVEKFDKFADWADRSGGFQIW